MYLYIIILSCFVFSIFDLETHFYFQKSQIWFKLEIKEAMKNSKEICLKSNWSSCTKHHLSTHRGTKVPLFCFKMFLLSHYINVDSIYDAFSFLICNLFSKSSNSMRLIYIDLSAWPMCHFWKSKSMRIVSGILIESEGCSPWKSFFAYFKNSEFCYSIDFYKSCMVPRQPNSLKVIPSWSLTSSWSSLIVGIWKSTLWIFWEPGY